jgi:PhnB protein
MTDIRKVQPYLFFDGRCEEAIEFYEEALGAKVERIMRMRDSPGGMPPGVPKEAEDKVMHASFHIGGHLIMASDGMASHGHPHFDGFSLSLAVPDEAEADRVFNALAAGGQVKMALAKTFFAPRFGMVADRFGVGWMVIVEAPA